MSTFFIICPLFSSSWDMDGYFFAICPLIQFVMGHRQEYLLYMTSYHYKQYII